MATNGVNPGTIIEDEDEFLADVEAFMTRRGVPFERDGKVAGRPAPLHKLYKLVMERGGYDEVTAGRMLWREMAKNFSFPAAHEGAMSYQLKLLYYKNLAAYEIESYWGEAAPPREILEDITAKGGNLRGRTVEGFQIPGNKGSSNNNDEESGSENESGEHTPKQERTEPEDPTSGSRYPSRLRSQPKPAQVQQPDPTPSRPAKMPRITNSPQPLPAPVQAYSQAQSDPRSPAFTLDRYEPRQPNVLTLRPAPTPGTNMEVFYQRKAMSRAATLPRIQPDYQDLLRPALPPMVMHGPNIYQRCVYGLRSGIREEQDFALHHLVKVSYERGDKFKFEGFPLLAETIIEKALEITELAFGVTFQVSYNLGPRQSEPNTLNAVHGTPELLETLHSLQNYLDEDELEPDDYISKLEKLNEAALVLRNMTTLEENAVFLSRLAIFRDFLIIAISLPSIPRFAEFRQYALDIAEMTTRFFDMRPADPLYLSLVKELDSEDRAKVLCALRAIFRYDAEAERISSIGHISIPTLERLVSFMMLDDDELMEATINFLYMYTAFHENIRYVVRSAPTLLASCTHRLARLFLHNAIPYEEKVYKHVPPPTPAAPPNIPVVPQELYNQLLHFSEPERSSRWLKCCFEESAQDDITQIAIWQAYSQRFQGNQPIAAADFIKNVSSTFTGAQAQVIAGTPPRFIIKGIRAKRVLVDIHGRPYFKCLWQVEQSSNGQSNQTAQRQTCSSWHSTAQNLGVHILVDHEKVPRNPDGKFNGEEAKIPKGGYTCWWVTCNGHKKFSKAAQLAQHVKIHLPESPEKSKELIYSLAGEPLTRPENQEVVAKHTFYYTATDEKGIATGIPFMSCLVLTNLARYIGRYGGNDNEKKQLMGATFHTRVRDELFYMWSVHKTIARLILDLIDLIHKGEASSKKGGGTGEHEHEHEREHDSEMRMS